MKKVLSLVLVIAMVLSSMSFAFAGTFEDVTGDYEDAVNALSALGVINGYEDGTFRPEKTITRAELAKILVEALGYGELVAGANSNFSDTQNHWANGYVAIAAGTGLVVGYPDGTFLPDKAVTYDEALTMVVRALGYTDATLKGTWPTNYKVKAIDLDLTDDVVMKSAAADRGGVAQILFNSLEVYLVEVDEDGIVVKTNKMLIDNIATPDTIEVDKNTVDPDHKDYAGDVVDLEPYMYETLNVYLNDDDEVVYVKDSDSLVVEGIYDSITVANGKTTVSVEDADGDDTDVVFGTTGNVNVRVYKNGVQTTADVAFASLEDTDSIKIVGYEVEDSNTEDGEIDTNEIEGIVITQMTDVAQIDEVYVEEQDNLDVFDLPVDSDKDVDLSKVTVTGAVNAIKDIEKDDIVAEYAAYEDAKLVEVTFVVSRETVEGKITRTNSTETKFYIDGTGYELNDFVSDVVAIGDEGTFFLDNNGDIVAFDGDNAEPEDYAVIVDAGVGYGVVENDVFGKYSIDKYPKLKLATADNEVVTYEVYVEVSSSNGAVKADYTDVVEYGLDGKLYAKDVTDNMLIKYALNEDGQIEAFEICDETYSNGTFDQDDASFNLDDAAVIFNANDVTEYAVTSTEDLDNEGTVIAVAFGKDGQIEALVTTDVNDENQSNYAYISTVQNAYDDNDDAAFYVVAYVNGEKVEYFTDGKSASNFDLVAGQKGVYTVDFDGDVIAKAVNFAGTTTTTAITSVSTSTNSVYNGTTRYFLTDDATIVELGTDSDGNATYSIADLYDVNKENATLYLVGGEVVFITYTK
jgi:hypothetical protein